MKRVFNLVLFSLLGLYIFSAPAKAQEDNRFRRDCNYVSKYDEDTDDWEEWQKGISTFVFNINENNDIRVHYPWNQVEVLRNMGGKEEKSNDNGTTTQTLEIMDEEGRMGKIGLLPNGVVLLFFENFLFRFSP